MNNNQIKFADVEKFTRFLVHLGSIYDVDEEGYVVNKVEDDEPVLIKVGTQYKRLMVMKETITDQDAVIINPLNENISESPDAKWLYSMLAVGLARRIIDLIRFTRVAIESSHNTEMHLSAAVMKFAARHKDLDEKVMEHFETIAKKKINFSNVWYNRKLKESRFRCALYDPDSKTEFPGITKKAWNVLTALVSDVLGVDKDPAIAADQIVEKFSAKSDLITAPKLESILEVYLKLYTMLNPYLDMCEMDDTDFVPDLTELGTHLNNIPAYYEKTKWFSSAVGASDSSRPAVRTIESSVPDQSGIPRNINVSPQRIGIIEQESGIPPNPSRRGIEYAPQHPVGMYPQNNMGFQPNQMFSQGGTIPTGIAPMYNQGYGMPAAGPIRVQPQPMGGFSIPVR